MNISRKTFFKKAAVLSGGLFLFPAAVNLTGCSASGESIRVSVSPEGIIKYDVSNTLKKPGDGALLEPDNADSKILLVRNKDNTFTALNPVCTHKGCEVIRRKDFIECPCHGSEFDLNGKVLKGPADEPLLSFRTEFDGKNTVTIFLK